MRLLALRIPSPSSLAADVARAVLSAMAHAISAGVVSLAAWAIGGLTHAATATSAVTLDTWFKGPWRAMVSVAGLVAIPLFLIGVVSALLRGEGAGAMAKVLGRLLGAAVGGVLALAGVELLLALVDVSCQIVEHVSGVSLASALARLGVALGVTGAVGGPQTAGIGAIVLALLAALGALVLWLELVVRGALLLVAAAFIPLALAGMLWPATASWMRRLAEVIAAVAVSKLVIVVVLILGAAALTASPLSISTPGADLDAVVSGVAFLAIATLGLPMALRLVPMASEAALGAGLGAVLVRRGLRAPTTASRHMSAARGLLHQVNGSGAGVATAGAGGAGGASAAGSGAGVAASMALATMRARPRPGWRGDPQRGAGPAGNGVTPKKRPGSEDTRGGDDQGGRR
jgi:type IV secretion system protein TrbL